MVLPFALCRQIIRTGATAGTGTGPRSLPGRQKGPSILAYYGHLIVLNRLSGDKWVAAKSVRPPAFSAQARGRPLSRRFPLRFSEFLTLYRTSRYGTKNGPP